MTHENPKQPRHRHSRFHFHAGRRTIVTQVSPTISLLRSDTTDNEIYLIGTAHISELSTELDTNVISTVRPETVFVELDSDRAMKLRQNHQSQAIFTNQSYRNEDMFEQAMKQVLQSMFSGTGKIGSMLTAGMMNNQGGGNENTLKNMFTALYRLLKDMDMSQVLR